MTKSGGEEDGGQQQVSGGTDKGVSKRRRWRTRSRGELEQEIDISRYDGREGDGGGQLQRVEGE